MAMADTKFIIICSSRNEILRMFDNLREFLVNDLSISTRLYGDMHNTHARLINSKIVIDIYSPYLKFWDGVRYDYFAISARSDFEQVQQLRYYLSRSGTELMTLHAIKEKIKEICLKEKTEMKFKKDILDARNLDDESTAKDLAQALRIATNSLTIDGTLSSNIRAYIDTDIAATRSAYERYKKPNTIINVIFNDPATIVFWNDGTKTVVKAQGDDIFDPEKGLAMAIAKKAMGNKGNYCNELKKWLPKEEKTEEEFDLDAFRHLLREKIAEALAKSSDEEPNV